MPAAVLEGVELEPILAAGINGCVVRELFEETGILLAEGVEKVDVAAARRRLLEKETTFAVLARTMQWRLDVSPLVYAGRWLTPPIGPVRFDNRFFLLEWSRDEAFQPEVCGSELVVGEWIQPAVALSEGTSSIS